MAESTPNIGDLFTTLTGGTNPFAGVGRTFEVLKKGATDLVAAAELTRSAMENLNSAATRINRILDDIEEPIRITVPQMTRAVKLANSLVDQMVDPIERVSPGLSHLADTLSSQTFTSMPNQIGEFLDVLGELARRLSPLTQLAESTASMFGIRGLSALTGGSSRGSTRQASAPAPIEPARAASTSSTSATTKKAAPTKAAAKKAAPKTTAAKKAAPRKAAATRSNPKKGAPKKTAAKRAAARR